MPRAALGGRHRLRRAAGQLRQLIQKAKGMCLAEAALAEPVSIQTLLAIKGDVVDPDVAAQAGEMKHAFPAASS